MIGGDLPLLRFTRVDNQGRVQITVGPSAAPILIGLLIVVLTLACAVFGLIGAGDYRAVIEMLIRLS